ncbi:MAG TPA: Asp-tRNA(Asn)/Glu-tRNA(Gln) amidotransferase subunit GatC [Planctomycetota bacterium]|nr:Asp-tRNA(Asn)/Glu-tRNA(Gln) amidotransferase subunit GatC [Planctomycetota bacterium]
MTERRPDSPPPSPSAPGGDIDAATVARVAQLARLGLDAPELERTAAQLGTILAHFRALQSVDTTGVEPLVHALEAGGEPALDAIVAFPQPRAALLALTDHAREGFFVVPAVLDTDFGAEDAAGSPGAGSASGSGRPAGRPARPAGDRSPDDDDPGADG